MKKYFINHIILFFQLIYLAASTLCLILTYYTITTPDTFNYLLISEQFIQGNFYEAISGHWSIGISILIAPLMALGLDGILAFKIVNAVIGFFTLTLFLQIIDTCTNDFSPRYPTAKVVGTVTSIAFIVILPFILSMTLELTPDLLLTTLLLWYLKILLQSCLAFSTCQTIPNYGSTCGLIAGLAYWSKAYTFPFFIAHFVGWHCILLINYFFYKKNQNKYSDNDSKNNYYLSPSLLFKNVLIGIVVFLMVCLPWVLALTSKFGEPSIGMSGTYNFALISPHRQHDQLTKNELINPQTKFTDFWAYEEPAQFVKKWNPLASHSDRLHYAKFLWSNIIRFCYFDYARHLIICLIISILLLFYWKIKLRRDEWLFIGLMVFTAFVFTSGYFLVLVRERYFWFDNFIGLIVLFFIGKIFYRANAVHPPTPSKGGDERGNPSKGGDNRVESPQKECTNTRSFSQSEKSPPLEGAGGWTALPKKFHKKILTLIIVLASALLIYDSIEMIQLQSSKQSFYKNLHQHLPELQALRGKRVATNDTWGAYHHTDAAVYLMYELRYQFWGQIRTQRLRREGLKEAKENEIDYFILWESNDLKNKLSEDNTIIFESHSPDMIIFQLNK